MTDYCGYSIEKQEEREIEFRMTAEGRVHRLKFRYSKEILTVYGRANPLLSVIHFLVLSLRIKVNA